MRLVNSLTRVVVDVPESMVESLGAEWSPLTPETLPRKTARKTTTKKQ